MENSKIEWTNHSWNPWYGCHKVSAGCKHCYMFRQQAMYGRDPNVVLQSKTTFNAPLAWERKAAATDANMLVFACSWSDWFIEEADPIRDAAWDIIRSTPHLVYQILTKRPQNIESRLPKDWGPGWPNVWLGVSVEDQEAANLRIPILQRIPCQVRFLSMEPLLGPVDLLKAVHVDEDIWFELNAQEDVDSLGEPEEFVEECEAELDWVNYGNDLVTNPEWLEYQVSRNCQALARAVKRDIDWIIVGGESGPQSRLMNPIWVNELWRLSIDLEIPFFFKQWGEWAPLHDFLEQNPEHIDDDYWYDVHTGMARVGRQLAGRKLGGRTWDAMPVIWLDIQKQVKS